GECYAHKTGERGERQDAVLRGITEKRREQDDGEIGTIGTRQAKPTPHEHAEKEDGKQGVKAGDDRFDDRWRMNDLVQGPAENFPRGRKVTPALLRGKPRARVTELKGEPKKIGSTTRSHQHQCPRLLPVHALLAILNPKLDRQRKYYQYTLRTC